MKKNKAYQVFNEIVGKRFESSEAIEEWIREITNSKLPGLSVGELKRSCCEECDDEMTCTFGENECGMYFADFTLWGIRTRAKEIYITEASWSY